METGEIVNKPIKRANFLEFFAKRSPCLIGMEACSGAHHWARKFQRWGTGSAHAGSFRQSVQVRREFAAWFWGWCRGKQGLAARSIYMASANADSYLLVKTQKIEEASLEFIKLRPLLFRRQTWD